VEALYRRTRCTCQGTALVAHNSTAVPASAHRHCRRDYEEGDADGNHGREEPAPHPQALSGDGASGPGLTCLESDTTSW